MKPNKKKVAERLQIIRNDLGWSIPMLAEKVGVSGANMGSYLRGLALPPEEVITKVSNITGYDIEWIYYGEIKEYIVEILESYGYKKFLEDYPEVIDEIYFDIENQTPNILRNKYPSEATVTDIFYDIYTPIFRENISELCAKYKEEISKYPLYTGSDEYNRDKYMNRVNYLIRSASPKIYYGDDEKIISIAEEEFKGRVEFYNIHHRKKLREIIKFEKEPDVLNYLIEKLQDDKGSVEIVRYLAHIKKKNFNSTGPSASRIIQAAKRFGEELELITKNLSAQDIKILFPDED